MNAWQAAVAVAVLATAAVAAPIPGDLEGLQELARQKGYVLLKPGGDDAVIAEEKSEDKLIVEMAAFFKDYAPGVERDAIGFRHLVKTCARYLFLGGGEMPPDVFNGKLKAYNERYLPLAVTIDLTPFPPAYTQSVKEFYATAILGSNQFSTGILDVVKRFAALPPDSHLISTRNDQDFRGLISEQVPDVTQLSARQQSRVWEFLAAVNPHVFESQGKQTRGVATETAYKIVAGKAIFPPSAFLLEIARSEK